MLETVFCSLLFFNMNSCPLSSSEPSGEISTLAFQLWCPGHTFCCRTDIIILFSKRISWLVSLFGAFLIILIGTFAHIIKATHDYHNLEQRSQTIRCDSLCGHFTSKPQAKERHMATSLYAAFAVQSYHFVLSH